MKKPSKNTNLREATFSPKKGEPVRARNYEELCLLQEKIGLHLSQVDITTQKMLHEGHSDEGFFVVKDLYLGTEVTPCSSQNTLSFIDPDLIQVSALLQGVDQGDFWCWWRFTNARIDELLKPGFVQLELF